MAKRKNYPGKKKIDVIEFAWEEYQRLKDQVDGGIIPDAVRFSELVARLERDHLPTLSKNSQTMLQINNNLLMHKGQRPFCCSKRIF